MNNIIRILFFVITLMLFPNFTLAEIKISYFNVDKVMQQSNVGKSIISQLEKIDKSNIKSFKDQEKKIKDFETDLISKKNIISKEDFKKEVEKLTNKVKNYKQERSKKIQEVTAMRVEATSKTLKLMNPILAKYAKENEISIILSNKSVIIGKTELDITLAIMDLVNKEIKSFTIK